MTVRAVLSWILIGFTSGAASGAAAQIAPPTPPVQSEPQQAQAQRGPLELDVVVTDKAGHPVPGLQQSDFTLLDNKQATPIKSFRAFDNPAPTTPANNPTQVFLVVDQVNTPFVAVSEERTQLHNYLTQNGGHLPLPVTILFLTDTGIQKVNEPTSDGLALDAQLQKQQSTLRAIPRSAGFYGGSDRMEISLRWLDSLAVSMGRISGRKLVVWISEGWWLFNSPNVYLSDRDRKSYFDTVVNLSAALWQAQAVLYAVNPQGTNDAGALRNVEWEQFEKPLRDVKHSDPGDLALQVFAIHSGGLVQYGSNDIASEVARCVADGSAWYALTFDPQSADTPHAWHDLEVRLDKAGLKARTRNGYYAGP
jgi:VWFA-related protein